MSELFWEDDNNQDYFRAGWEGFQVVLNMKLDKMNPTKRKRAKEKILSLKKQMDILEQHANSLIESEEYLDSKEIDVFIQHEEEIIAKMGLAVGIKGLEIDRDSRREHYKRVVSNNKESDELYDQFIHGLNARASNLVLHNLEKSDDQLREDIEIELALYVVEFNNKYEYDIPISHLSEQKMYDMYQEMIDYVRNEVSETKTVLTDIFGEGAFE